MLIPCHVLSVTGSHFPLKAYGESKKVALRYVLPSGFPPHVRRLYVLN